MPLQPRAFFLDTPRGARYCQLHAPSQGALRGILIHIHPFAEEMNKARRMAALQARAFAESGYAVLQIDLHGCGDSAGDFGEASWQGWIDDVVAAAKWLRSEAGLPGQPIWLWGLRAGCLLAAAAASLVEGPVNLLFWAPTPAGKALLQQFLRLKAAGDLMGGQSKAILEAARKQLAEGATVDVAGYALPASVANGLEQATLQPSSRVDRLLWLELSTREDAALTPLATTAIARWESTGTVVQSQFVSGPAFWQTTEIEDAPALIAATLDLVQNPAVATTQAAPTAP